VLCAGARRSQGQPRYRAGARGITCAPLGQASLLRTLARARRLSRGRSTSERRLRYGSSADSASSDVPRALGPHRARSQRRQERPPCYSALAPYGSATAAAGTESAGGAACVRCTVFAARRLSPVDPRGSGRDMRASRSHRLSVAPPPGPELRARIALLTIRVAHGGARSAAHVNPLVRLDAVRRVSARVAIHRDARFAQGRRGPCRIATSPPRPRAGRSLCALNRLTMPKGHKRAAMTADTAK